MSLTSLVPALLLAATSPGAKGCAPDPAGSFSSAGAEAYIRQAETDWAASVAKNEAAYLPQIIAGDFVGVLEGKVLDRSALLSVAEARREGAASDTLEAMRVHLAGSTAVAEGVELWTDKVPLRRTRLIWSDIWVHCDGAWRLVTSTSVGASAD